MIYHIMTNAVFLLSICFHRETVDAALFVGERVSEREGPCV